MHTFNLTDFSNGKIKHVRQSLQEQDVHLFFSKVHVSQTKLQQKIRECFQTIVCRLAWRGSWIASLSDFTDTPEYQDCDGYT